MRSHRRFANRAVREIEAARTLRALVTAASIALALGGCAGRDDPEDSASTD